MQVPDAIFVSKFFESSPDFWQNAALKTGHVEEQVWIVLAVDRNKAGLPLDSGDRAGKPILDVPEDGAAQIHVVFHEAHASIARPTLPVVVANNVLVVGVRVLRQVALDQVSCLLCRKAKEEVDTVDVARVVADWV